MPKIQEHARGAAVTLRLTPHDPPRDARGPYALRVIAELVDESGWLTTPFAAAWLTDARRGPMGLVYLDFVMVPDFLRRRGRATELVRRLRDHYGDALAVSEPVTAVGEALFAGLERRGLLG